MQFKGGKELGEIIKMYREEKGVSTRALSRQIDGVSEFYISQLERGRLDKNPNYDAIIQAFRILGLTDSEINNYIPLEEYRKEKERWYEDKIQHIIDLSNHMPKEYKQKLVKKLQDDMDSDGRFFVRLNSYK